MIYRIIDGLKYAAACFLIVAALAMVSFGSCKVGRWINWRYWYKAMMEQRIEQRWVELEQRLDALDARIGKILK
jgi:hypothetical protein